MDRMRGVMERCRTVRDVVQVQSLMLKTSLEQHPFFVSQFLLYASSISLPLSLSVFHSLPILPPLFAWNTLIRSLAHSPTPLLSLSLSLSLFRRLLSSPLRPDHFTFPFILHASASSSSSSPSLLPSLHSLILKSALLPHPHVANALLNAYARSRHFTLARNLFDQMPVRDVVSWTSIIAACVASNHPFHALLLFRRMNQPPNSVTLVSLLSACTKLLHVRAGESVHSYITRNRVQMDVALGTALFQMYAKCGRIEKALLVFHSVPAKNLQSCTIMISALADHGRQKDAISLFNLMEDMGLRPDGLSFAVIISACSHAGLVYEGKRFFDRMVTFYNIKPTVEHYGCMVDLLGRAGLLQEACDIIKNMPMKPNDVILRSFLGACTTHGWVPRLDDNVLSKLESELGANYVLAANIFSTRASWKDANDSRLAMKKKGLKKIPGCSWVEVQN